jgi:hypothetical protein
VLTQPLQDLEKESPPLIVPSMKVEQRVDTRVVEVVLHQIVLNGFTISIDVAPMLHPSPPRGRSRGQLHRCIYYSLIQQISYLVFGHVNIRA